MPVGHLGNSCTAAGSRQTRPVVGIREAVALIGKRGTLTTREGLEIPVRVLEARQVYARIEVLVKPIHGAGEAWIRADRLTS